LQKYSKRFALGGNQIFIICQIRKIAKNYYLIFLIYYIKN